MQEDLLPFSLPLVRRSPAQKLRWIVATALAGVLAANLLVQAPSATTAQAAHAAQPPAVEEVPSVPVAAVAANEPDPVKPLPPASNKPAPVWPDGGVAFTDLVAARGGMTVRPGGLPVQVTASDDGSARSAGNRPERRPERVRVEVLDRAATVQAGVRGVLLRLAPEGDATDGEVSVSVDYGAFATAYGADWASRLRLVSMPDCAMTSAAGDCAGNALPGRNDLAATTVTATVPLAASGSLVALVAGPSGPAGDLAATSLLPSSTWAVGGNSGTFSWSHPMRVPPAAGGLAPSVSLAYSSQSVDGRHAASNNQPSWIGEGFDTSGGGFIERRYRACANDMGGQANNTVKTGDLCWETDNAVLSMFGRGGELIYNAQESRWHLRNDEGSRIERKTGATNGDNNGEYWVLTTTDGVQYWFGVNRLPGWASGNPVTNSAWNVPVFGNDPNEPCRAATFANSHCMQTWRWNLDYIVDLHGNSVSYWYSKEANQYGRNLVATDAASYDRGGWLDRIDYGTRRVSGVDSVFATPAPARVDFAVADRCLSNCGVHDEAHWPDTPWDSECTGSSCNEVLWPTFWSTKRLASVTTQVRSGGAYDNVERWTLTHTFPDPGDGTRAGLWLSTITQTGLVGAAISMPAIEFTEVQLANRVDTNDFAPAMNWLRITRIRHQSGGTTNITYSGEDCVAGQTPTPHTNTRLCYPVLWTPEGYQQPVTDWFQKYVVTKIYETDHTGGGPPQGSPPTVYSYSYLDGAAWRYSDDDGLIDSDSRTWSGYRGFKRVGVTVGDPGEQTYTETRFFQGMHGDRAGPAGGTRTVTIDGINDEDWYVGLARETRSLNGPGGAVVSRQVNDPWASPVTASRTVNGQTVTARFTRVGSVRYYTALDAGRGERSTRVVATYDLHGMAATVDDHGDVNISGDEQCTKLDYTPRNESNWLMDRPHRVQSYAVGCAVTSGTLAEADVLGEMRTLYDGNAFETVPTRGLATRADEMSAWNNGASTFVTVSQSSYDAHGRSISVRDAMNSQTTTAYTPATGGPVTSVTITNAMQHATTTTVAPAWGLPLATVDPNGKRTDMAYDSIGRMTSVWLPGRDKATQSANATYAYHVRNNAATTVASSRLNAEGAYVTSYSLYDGLLRPRQTQTPSPSGGRILTDTFYDSAGRVVKEYGAYHDGTDLPGINLYTATEAAFVYTQTRAVYDGAGRMRAAVFQPFADERWRTSVYYAGDRVDVTPPEGGTTTSTLSDTHGRTVELRQYHGATPTPGSAGSWDSSTYHYNRKGLLQRITDNVGNNWTYGYDFRGRQTQVTDPDKGASTFTYDNAGRVTTSTDARGEKLAYLYDPLNRKRAVYDDEIGGTPRAQWIYDTILKGALTQSTRIEGSAFYQVRVTGYNDRYQPTGTQVTIPATETGLAGIYNTFLTWNVDGSLASLRLPSTNNDLPDETLLYSYSDLGLPTRLETEYGGMSSQYVAGTTYNAFGQPTQVTLDTDDILGERVSRAFAYEVETGRMSQAITERDTVAPNRIAEIHYIQDHAGNVTSIRDEAQDPVDDTQCFNYDHLRRLTQAWTPSSADCATAPSAAGLGGPAPYWHSWTFDSVGNRRTQSVHTTGGIATTTYNYPAAGAVRPHALASTTGAQTGTYTYDAAGNTATRPTVTSGTQTLGWDSEGRLANSTDSSGATSYLYDADGNRLIRRDPGGKTLYLPGQEIRYNSATTSTSATRYYSHLGSTVGSRTMSGLSWLASDHQGTSSIAVDSVSQALTVRRQTPYGTPRGAVPTWPNSKGFVGGTIDNTGLTHLGAREYDPVAGRFISVDPVHDLTDPQQWNPYSYANNSPVTYSDPSGMIYTDFLVGNDPHVNGSHHGLGPSVKGGTIRTTHCNGTGPYDCQAKADAGRYVSAQLKMGPPRSWQEELAGEVACTLSGFCRGISTGYDGYLIGKALFEGDLRGAAAAGVGFLTPGCPTRICGGIVGKLFGGSSTPDAPGPTVKPKSDTPSSDAPAGGSTGKPTTANTGSGSGSGGGRGSDGPPTGASVDGATGVSASSGNGLGRLSGREIRVSDSGLARVEAHLSQFGQVDINDAMISRLREANASGTRISGGDASFYMHELSESQFMKMGMDYMDAHAAAFSRYDVSPFSVYPPEVVSQFSSQLSPGYKRFWGLG
ncbi:RHS repeat-associated protein [Micromonospora sp. Llam0]|uniref:RHS repeat-associated core domain-containing protein n=1 Tax=Micromonospora sp. Llam0 TaxID=2485143 RepID=UPI000F925F6B|nr:RHS repeat-associated core domain-containing protein [Micromonospora sp. Llam0]ROO59297.1 RHS repeat-associated protein [Micromonospora sp. Llam0]